MQFFAVAPVQQGIADWAAAQWAPMLTPIQIDIIAFIHGYQRMWGQTPLYREIAQACRLGGDSAVAYQVHRMRKLGVLGKPYRLVRAMRLNVVLVPCR